MEAEKVYKSFVEKAKFYLLELDFYGKYQFTLHPMPGKWSMGQLYDLLIHGITAYHLKQIEDCLAKRNGQENGKKTFAAKMLFGYKKLYPFRIKGVNYVDYEPVQPDSPDKSKDDLYKFFKVMKRVSTQIDEARDFTYTTKHPHLGMLNALEWYKLIDIYYKNQLKLKKTLDPKVRSHTKELALEVE